MFENSTSAENWFSGMLVSRGIEILEIEIVREYVRRGRWAYPKLITCNNSELYFLTFWKKSLDQIWDTSRVTDDFRELNDRLVYTKDLFGGEVSSFTQFKETSIMYLLEKEKEGFTSFMVVMYGNGEVYWRKTTDVYNFIMRYGTYQTFRKVVDPNLSLIYRVPTGWMISWKNKDPIKAYPSIMESR